MYKRGFITCFLLFAIMEIAFSQGRYTQNPFSKLSFSKGFTDTTLIVSFYGISNDISVSNKSIIESIAKNTGKKIKGLNYSIEIKTENYSLLSIASKDKSIFETLRMNVGKNAQIRIKCIVYRFYTFDGICNFFYIDKVSLI